MPGHRPFQKDRTTKTNPRSIRIPEGSAVPNRPAKPDIKKGDVVVLKSGSPRMTVDEIFDTGMVQCVWFLSGVERSTDLNPESLKRVRH